MFPGRQHKVGILAVTVLVVLATYGPASAGNPLAPATLPTPDGVDAVSRLGFVENRGQLANDEVRYFVASGRLRVGFAEGAVLYTLSSESATVLVRASYRGANPVAPQGREALPYRSHYFLGDDPARWRTNVPTFGGIVYEGLYPGVDLRYRVAADGVKYEFALAAGADPRAIRVEYEGIDGLALTPSGDLTVRTAAGDLHDTAPVALQAGASVRCAFVLPSPRSVGFDCTGQDASRPFTIDPLLFATYLGGSGYEEVRAIAVDGAGNAYVAGQTTSTDFPTTPGAYDRAYGGGLSDAFVAKFDPTGSRLLYATFIGGGDEDYASALAVDSLGYAFAAGQTYSADFPTTPGAYDRVLNGTEDVFVLKLSPEGSALSYSTLLGGAVFETARGLVVDSLGRAYLAGETASPDFPTTPGALDRTFQGPLPLFDGYVAALDASGGALLFSTFLAGNGSDTPRALTRDASGNVYVTGITTSTNFPRTTGAFRTSLNGVADAFVVKLDPTGSALLYGTYVGGGGGPFDGDIGTAIAVDGAGTAFVGGYTNTNDFPTTPGAFDRTHDGGTSADGFVFALNAAGTALLFSTYLGGPGDEEVSAIALDAAGRAVVAGHTRSPTFPVTPGADNTTYLGGIYDAFVTKLDASGSRLVYSTFLGGSGTDQAHGLVLDGAGDAYLAGVTNSTNFPVTAGAASTRYGGAGDAFVAKVRLGFALALATSPPGLQVEVDGGPVTTPYEYACEAGGTHAVTAPSPQVASSVRYAFRSWSDGGAQSHTVTCTGPMTLTAAFLATEYEIVIATSPPALQVRVDGSPANAPHALWCVPTSSHTVDVPSPQVVGPTRYLFRDWSDGGAPFHTVVCDAPGTVAASFATEHEVVVATSPPGLQVLADGVPYPTPRSFWWAEGSAHALDAPSPQTQGPTRFVFTAWTDGGTKNRSVAVAGPGTFTAAFASQYEIGVATTPPGLQVVVDGVAATTPHAAWCEAGRTIDVDVPTPQGGAPTRYAFGSWSDGGARAHAVPCDGARTLTASFSPEHEVVLRTIPGGLGVEVDGVPATAPQSFWCPEGESRLVGTPSPQGGGASRLAFSAWSDRGARSHAVPCTGPATLTALFAVEHQVVVTTSPPGMLVTVDGVTAPAPRSFWSAEGSSHAVDVPSPQGVAPTRYAFRSWSDGGAKAHAVTVTEPLTLTATLAPEHLVTLETDPPGLVVTVDGVPYATPAAAWRTEGAVLEVGAPSLQAGARGVRYVWSSWSDGGARAHAVTVTGPLTLTAGFGTQYRLTATSAHGQPQCDADDCWYDAGTVAALSIDPFVVGPPGTRYAFRGWSGDVTGGAYVAVPMDRPKDAVATWATQHFLRVVSLYGTTTGEGWYDEGMTVAFSVSPTDIRGGAKRYRFAGWTGDAPGTAPSGTVLMDGPKTVVATWVEASGTDVAAAAFLAILSVFAAVLLLALWWQRRRDRDEEGGPPPDAG